MLELIQKRYKIGDTITITTEVGVFTGQILDFGDGCIVLQVEEREEIIPTKEIKHITKSPQTSPQTEISKEEKLKPKEETLQDNQTKQVENKPTKNVLELQKGIHTNNLSELYKLLPKKEKENEKLVPANGTITAYFSDKQFGFISDKYENSIWFQFPSILEKELVDSLKGNTTKANIPVLFTLTQNPRGDVAIHIHKPKSIEKIIELAKFYLQDKKKPEISIGLVKQILEVYPHNHDANELKKKIEFELQPKIKSLPKPPEFNYYQKAKKLHTVDKQYEEALKNYLLAFEKNQNRESCIKDISMLYISLEKREEALNFMKQHEAELAKEIKNYYFLENFYTSVREFKKSLEYLDLLLKEPALLKDKRKHSLYLAKKGYVFIQLNEREKAKQVLEQARKVHPDNNYAVRLLEALEKNDQLEQIPSEEIEFNIGFSKFIKDTLENYNEYFGVPTKVIESASFSKETLQNIRKTIDTAGRSRPRERAKYLLTEAKLMEILDEEVHVLHSVLAKYCNAMALTHTFERSPMDVVRFYYLEAFRLEENYQSTAPQIALFLLSFRSNYEDLLQTKSPSIDDTLAYVFTNPPYNLWEGILSMFLNNKKIADVVIKKLYDNYRAKSIEYLGSFKKDFSNSTEISENEYFQVWKKAIEIRKRDYKNFSTSIKALLNSESLENFLTHFLQSYNELRKPWLPQLDTNRLKEIYDVYETLLTYSKQLSYKEKERNYRFAEAKITELIKEFQEKPTQFSYEEFVPLLKKLKALLDKSFKILEEASTPKVKLSILRDSYVENSEGIVPFQLMVENSEKNSSPIRETSVNVISNKDIEFINDGNIFYDDIDGGENHIFKLKIKVSNQVIKNKVAVLDVECNYKIKSQNEPVKIREQLSLRLYSENEFTVIENPYAPMADGGPVQDEKMFYGRDEFIESRIQAILNSDTKQIIIYGQKRSGKSSVLYHLKKRLEKTNKAFCISFSLGDIIQNLNEYTFYHKIISRIDRELRIKKSMGEEVPFITVPSEKEFLEKYPNNPVSGFIEILEDFKLASQKFSTWKDKKLVVMIDEFTYLYTAIKQGRVSDTILKQWKAATQNENAKFSVVLVGQDVIPSFKKEDYARNAFGIIEDIRLTYLDKESAQRLIEEPILHNGESRFIGKAVEHILDYTSRNPYYIQIFCSRLVDYMNSKKIIKVTEADIKDVAETFLEGSQALGIEKFDNLIRSGEEHDLAEFDDEKILSVLRQIALASKNIGFCPRENISLQNKELEDKILNNLVDREVLEKRQGNHYKIKVRLFQEWLLRH